MLIQALSRKLQLIAENKKEVRQLIVETGQNINEEKCNLESNVAYIASLILQLPVAIYVNL